MKTLVNSRMKNSLTITYDESTERLERYLHTIGLIECYRFAVSYSDENRTQSNNFYKSSSPTKTNNPIEAQVKSELKKRYTQVEDIENDDSFEPEEKAILIAGVQKEIKQLKDYIKKKAIKVVNEPFEAQKLNYLKSIKKNCRVFKRTQIRLNPFVKQVILQYLFQKVHNGIMKGKLNIAYIHLFHIVGLEVYLTEILRKYRDSNTSYYN